MTCLFRLGICGRNSSIEMAEPAKLDFYNFGNFPRHTSARDMRVAFQVPYVCDYMTKLCRRETEIFQNRENENVRKIVHGGTPLRKHSLFKK
jgi:hypothetical protein